MRRKLSIGCLLLAWLCANGALLDMVQVVAWGRMFAGYNETMSVGAALRETFDPNKPCELCVGVAEAKETAQQQLPPVPEQSYAAKVVLVCDAPAPIVFSSFSREWPSALASAGPSRCDPVPVRPPRAIGSPTASLRA